MWRCERIWLQPCHMGNGDCHGGLDREDPGYVEPFGGVAGCVCRDRDNAYKRQCPGSTFKLASLLALVEDKGYDIDARFPVVDGEVTSAPKDKRVKIGNGYSRALRPFRIR